LRLTALAAAVAAAALAGCVAPAHTSVHADMRVGAPAWTPPPPPVSVYIEPPLVQPEPVFVDVAPPPMLVEVPPPSPFSGAVWTGGYWGWHQSRWVWCAGRWSAPPRPDYVWVQPYYEHRDGAVVFVSGFWAAHDVAFVPPPSGLHLAVEVAIGGGSRPMGPMGVFVPPPPGSRPGLIVPAPIGTPPAVVVSAPPVVNVGMRVQHNVNTDNSVHNTVNNTTTNISNVNNVRNVSNITNVTIVAPAGATASGKAFQNSVPAAAHLAAALPAQVHAPAPLPTSNAAVPTYSPRGHAAGMPSQDPQQAQRQRDQQIRDQQLHDQQMREQQAQRQHEQQVQRQQEQQARERGRAEAAARAPHPAASQPHRDPRHADDKERDKEKQPERRE
jgi:hypothetical protein